MLLVSSGPRAYDHYAISISDILQIATQSRANGAQCNSVLDWHSHDRDRVRTKTLRHGPKTALAQSYGLGSRTLFNARPTFEAIITRRRSRRPIFQPKRHKAIPTSMKQAMLSIPCTICPSSALKSAPSLTLTNPVIAPIKQKSIAAHEAFPKFTYHSSWFLTKGSKRCAQNAKFLLTVGKYLFATGLQFNRMTHFFEAFGAES
jgi:hypothetical protein